LAALNASQGLRASMEELAESPESEIAEMAQLFLQMMDEEHDE